MVKTKAKETVHERIAHRLADDRDELATRVEKTNVGQQLYNVFFWQEVFGIAKAKLEDAWAAAQAKDGFIDSDDDLRDHGKGEHIVCESERFTCLATVQDPRMNFDRELFLTAICKAYKLNREAVDKIAENCRVASRAPLQKRVVEA